MGVGDAAEVNVRETTEPDEVAAELSVTVLETTFTAITVVPEAIPVPVTTLPTLIEETVTTLVTTVLPDVRVPVL